MGEDLVLTHAVHGKLYLKTKVEDCAARRAGEVEANDAKVITSVTERSERTFMRGSKNTDIDWSAVEKM